MSDSNFKAAVLLVGSLVLLAALYLQPSLTFTTMITLHALAISIPSGLRFVLNDVHADSFVGVLSMIAMLTFGVAIAGVFASIMLSAGILFIVLSIVLIIVLLMFE